MATNTKKPYSEMNTAPVSAIRVRTANNRAWGDLYDEFLLRLEKTPATHALFVVFEDERLLRSARQAFFGYMKRDGLTKDQIIFQVARHNGQRVLTARRGPEYGNGKSK